MLARRHSLRLLALGIAGSLIGCSAAAPVPKLAQVTGTVQIEGTPAADVTVIFNPAQGTKSTGATGVTGPDGKFELVHRSGEKGIEPGNYVVTFSRLMIMPGNKPVPAGTSPTDVGAVETIPPRFQNPENKTHEAVVKPEGSTFDFGIGAPKK